VVPTPAQKMINKRTNPRNPRFPNDGRLGVAATDDPFVASSEGLAALG
jgi:hypothetical protein